MRTSICLRCQLLQQHLRLPQIARVVAFSEPAVHRSQQFARLLALAQIKGYSRRGHQGRGDLSGPVPRARHHGADELHRPRSPCFING
jgi:hypothetical protein